MQLHQLRKAKNSRALTLGLPSGAKVVVSRAKEVEKRSKRGEKGVKNLEKCAESLRKQLRKVEKCDKTVAGKVERAPGTLSGDVGDVSIDQKVKRQAKGGCRVVVLGGSGGAC